MTRGKGVLTTGQVAAICHVAPRTVSKWFDGGHLKGYLVPGSKDRRIPVDNLVRFMREHGMPTDELETGKTRILVVDGDVQRSRAMVASLEGNVAFEAVSAASAFAAGVAACRFKPHVILVETDSLEVCRTDMGEHADTCANLRDVRFIAISSEVPSPQKPQEAGFDEWLIRPFDAERVADAIDAVLASRSSH